MANLGGQPIFIMSEDAERQTGKNAQENNINACKSVANAIRTTLGPKGMDKMMVDSVGDLVVTNDGVTILDEMELEHPAAKMMVEIAKTQDEEVGDGTTTAVVLAGELLKKSEDLLDQDIHPTVISSGYRLAKERALEELNQIAEDVSFDDREKLESVAKTAMTGKSAEASKDYLASIAADAVTSIADSLDGSFEIDRDLIKVVKSQGGSVDDTELVEGVVIDKEKVHPDMPSRKSEADIALLNTAMEVQETETSAEIQINDPNKLQEFVDQEEESLKEMVEQVKESGADVVLCQKGIDDIAQHYLAKNDIMAVRRVKKSDMEKLAKATGGRVVTSLTDLSQSDLGKAGNVGQENVSGDSMLFVEDIEEAESVTIVVRGGTEHVVDEIERAFEDALGGIASAIRVGKVVGGGGAPEVEVSKELKNYADRVGGREQLAINAFAEALEIVPRTLAENAGLDPIDILVDLRNKHEAGDKWSGIDVFSGEADDLFDRDVVEPLQIKTQAVQSASEAAELILRIDDVISASGFGGGEGGGEPPAPGGAPGGAGGMPGGMGGMM
ncbi:MAG: TCP-1/cpn60 chaperonin family protein [Candidatus Nanohaloarchaeota archaeon QJJ-9]|nr:TCP-1/cpn60 chaperonin family protein [Candidatus Nanohaloarchaeota archaeon QJJ-9]